MWKDFFFFTKGERSGIVVLCCLIGLMFSVNFCLPTQTQEEQRMVQKMNELMKDSVSSPPPQNHYNAYSASDTQHDTIGIKKETNNQRSSYHSEGRGEKRRNRTPAFNYDTVRVEINSADTTELKRLRGIGSVLSARIVKYRKKIGGFTSVDQLRNIYGLSQETYEEILPHIWIK
ncbi:MAG: helix-hairpin-helix domain-containing protein [Paludibacteraceae bacterium]|nr:helix-hairpin-helix domain-containing protein [Paludibacteraceae bacterium]